MYSSSNTKNKKILSPEWVNEVLLKENKPLTDEEVNSLIMGLKEVNIQIEQEDIDILSGKKIEVLSQEEVDETIDTTEKKKEKESKEMKKIMLILAKDLIIKEIYFIGKYRRDLEKDNWHYYETNEGKIIHVKKENMLAVIDENI